MRPIRNVHDQPESLRRGGGGGGGAAKVNLKHTVEFVISLKCLTPGTNDATLTTSSPPENFRPFSAVSFTVFLSEFRCLTLTVELYEKKSTRLKIVIGVQLPFKTETWNSTVYAHSIPEQCEVHWQGTNRPVRYCFVDLHRSQWLLVKLLEHQHSPGVQCLSAGVQKKLPVRVLGRVRIYSRCWCCWWSSLLRRRVAIVVTTPERRASIVVFFRRPSREQTTGCSSVRLMRSWPSLVCRGIAARFFWWPGLLHLAKQCI